MSSVLSGPPGFQPASSTTRKRNRSISPPQKEVQDTKQVALFRTLPERTVSPPLHREDDPEMPKPPLEPEGAYTQNHPSHISEPSLSDVDMTTCVSPGEQDILDPEADDVNSTISNSKKSTTKLTL